MRFDPGTTEVLPLSSKRSLCVFALHVRSLNISEYRMCLSLSLLLNMSHRATEGLARHCSPLFEAAGQMHAEGEDTDP